MAEGWKEVSRDEERIVSGRVHEFLADVMVVVEFKAKQVRGKETGHVHMVMGEKHLLVVEVTEQGTGERVLVHRFSLRDFIDTYADKYVLTKLWEFYTRWMP